QGAGQEGHEGAEAKAMDSDAYLGMRSPQNKGWQNDEKTPTGAGGGLTAWNVKRSKKGGGGAYLLEVRFGRGILGRDTARGLMNGFSLLAFHQHPHTNICSSALCVLCVLSRLITLKPAPNTSHFSPF